MNKDGTPLLSRSYHIPLAMFDDAFRAFQKKYVFPMNLLFTAVLLAIAGVYVHAAVKDSSNTFAYLLIVVCVALILVRWYRMFKLRRSVHEALKEVESDTYALSVFEDGIVIRTEDAKPETDEEPEEAAAESFAPAEENANDGNGFNPIFPEKPADAEEIPATEIPFGSNVKIHEFAEFFMVYLVKQNFYVIPKKDFSEDEILKLRQIFTID